MKHLLKLTFLLLAILLPATVSATQIPKKMFTPETKTGSHIISFADDDVKAICVERWDTNGDGELSIEEAAVVTSLRGAFDCNPGGGGGEAGLDINSFDELVFFTGLTSIEDNAFRGCCLTSLTIPSSVTSIGSHAFELCFGLTSINIPSSVTSIGSYAFEYCFGLTSINVPSSVTSIGDGAFCHCHELSSINIPSGVTIIGSYVFYNCYELSSINIPSGVTIIGDYAFDGCTDLTSINIPSSVTSIGDYAFDCCTSLTSINIPSGVTSIGKGTFCDCSGLTSINIPSGLTSISDYAFSGCTGLTSITIPSGVTSIGKGTFCDCSGLSSINIPSGVTSIVEDAFSGCTGLTSITIPSSVTSIGSYAFSGCDVLNDVYSEISDPSQVTMGNNAFSRSPQNYSNRRLHVPVGSLAAYRNDSKWSDYFGSIVVIGIPSTTSIVFADRNVKAICTQRWDTNGDGELSEGEAAAVTSLDGAFSSNEEITSFDELAFFTELTAIEDSAFFGCSGLTSITIPSRVTSIGDCAFSLCASLENFIIPSSVKTIGADSFLGCENLIRITLLGTVPGVESYYAFMGCNKLEIIDIADLASWCQNSLPINDPGTFGIQIYYHLYLNGEEVTELVIPKSVKSINKNTFSGCSYLTSVTIPNSVTAIDFYAFSGCTSLTSISIPSSVSEIRWSAFADCNNLEDVYCHITDIDDIMEYEDEPFWAYHWGDDYGSNYSSRILHVPTGMAEAYNQWHYFFGNIVEMGPMMATSIELDKSTAFMKPGDNLQLMAELQPIEAIYNEVLWGSSNPDVATVSNDGLVTAVNVGTATITAMTTDGSNLSASCIVTVYTEMMGDVDGNGSVNISDVTALVDYLLNGDPSAILLINADCDGSGVVNISDVTELIDYLLSGSWSVDPETEPVITPYTVNGVSFNMVEVEGGTFMMGATPEQGDEVWDKEKPVHEVTLTGFNIGQTEVTQELWQAVMGENPSDHTGDLQRPVDQVSWVDCIAFISKLNELTGKSFRLPTEAEWEYAARGGSKSEGYRYAGGNDMDVVSWYIDNSDNTTHPVATKAPNELGLYDMTGNVWEWCNDWYHRYTADAQVDPMGQATGSNRVLRGGCWNGDANYNRISFRDNFTPTGSNSSGGMRLVLDMDNSPKFRMSETVIKVYEGKSMTVNILNGGGSYTVAGGTDFVSTAINGNQLTVTGIATGTTTVHVTDAETGATAVIAVIVI